MISLTRYLNYSSSEVYLELDIQNKGFRRIGELIPATQDFCQVMLALRQTQKREIYQDNRKGYA